MTLGYLKFYPIKMLLHISRIIFSWISSILFNLIQMCVCAKRTDYLGVRTVTCTLLLISLLYHNVIYMAWLYVANNKHGTNRRNGNNLLTPCIVFVFLWVFLFRLNPRSRTKNLNFRIFVLDCSSVVVGWSVFQKLLLKGRNANLFEGIWNFIS